ncbi:uncharacterized protein LOC131251400 isoform X2 [Magnolia sinica]|uniref:uncharacterized protein LOC131251400 isoform X2 n=2 Tax=Magnolia sinica TaxID=86752 RepID=UPI00265A15F7|nr:uncharacterized protein LOC131251400 isoform X2 [Magnolia sinica]
MVDQFSPALAISHSCCMRQILFTCSIVTPRSSFHGRAVVNSKIIFVPLLAFEVFILVDNFRMCGVSMPGDDGSMNDEAIWETLPEKIRCRVCFEGVINMVLLPCRHHILCRA